MDQRPQTHVQHCRQEEEVQNSSTSIGSKILAWTLLSVTAMEKFHPNDPMKRTNLLRKYGLSSTTYTGILAGIKGTMLRFTCRRLIPTLSPYCDKG